MLSVVLAICATSSWILRFWLKRENKKLDISGEGDLYGFRYVT